ncbi:type 2 periplasmic-binding domain-containing protein [Auraticoccus cholistanensis]|uniref:hypothetical protein n=1 Tax=Auraticoccus cholistanensis TaxID=2656650 RepID=UPI0018D270F1|nr:hypothetical protein [Auraticoccus cholistanensis]
MTPFRIALRDWDWLTPLLLGELGTEPLDELGLELQVERVPALPDLWSEPGLDAAEISLSRYCLAVADGRSEVVAVPHVLMQGFRHRCVIVAAGSEATSAADLRGGRIGLTGWPDSGNTWTRAALADDGLGLDDARWFTGRLTADHPEQDRLGGHGVPGHIEALTGTPLVERLSRGELDAVLTPFMPPGFHSPDAPWRPLYPDVRAAEAGWVRRHGFVPGHHLLGFRTGVAPEVAAAVSEVLLRSREAWRTKRAKYAETSAWLAVDLVDEARLLPPGWDTPGLAEQGPMVAEFTAQQRHQRLHPSPPQLTDLFPLDLAAPLAAGRTYR